MDRRLILVAILVMACSDPTPTIGGTWQYAATVSGCSMTGQFFLVSREIISGAFNGTRQCGASSAPVIFDPISGELTGDSLHLRFDVYTEQWGKWRGDSLSGTARWIILVGSRLDTLTGTWTATR